MYYSTEEEKEAYFRILASSLYIDAACTEPRELKKGEEEVVPYIFRTKAVLEHDRQVAELYEYRLAQLGFSSSIHEVNSSITHERPVLSEPISIHEDIYTSTYAADE